MKRILLLLVSFLLIGSCCLFENVFASTSSSSLPDVQQQQQQQEAAVDHDLTPQNIVTKEGEDEEDNVDPTQESTNAVEAAGVEQQQEEEEEEGEDFSNLQKNLNECLLQSHQQSVQLSTKFVQTQELREKMTLFESQLSSVQSNYDSLVQSSNECKNERKSLLENNQDMKKQLQVLEERCDSRASMFQKEKEEMKSNYEILQRQYKEKNNEYYQAREQIHKLEKELQNMYEKSESTYINLTLIRQDLGWAVMKRIDQAVEFLERVHHSKTVVDLKRKVMSTVIHPLAQKCLHWYKVHHGQEHVRSLQERLHRFEVLEKVRLTLVSSVQHGSNIVLIYMDLTSSTESGKDGNGSTTTNQENPWYAASFHSKLQRKSKTVPRVKSWVKEWMQYAQENAEKVVHDGIWMFVGVIILMLIVLPMVWRVMSLILFGRLSRGKKQIMTSGNKTARKGKNKKKVE